MGLDDVAKGAILLIGAGIISERLGAGPGLTGLGTGIRTIAAAPLGGVGAGLGEFAGGVRAIGESFGDIGRGLAEIFKAIPTGPYTGIPFSPIVIPEPPAPSPLPYYPTPTPAPRPAEYTTLPYYPTPQAGGGYSAIENLSETPKNGNGIRYTQEIAGGGYTFPGAGTYYRTKEAAIKNYSRLYGKDPLVMDGQAL